MKRSYHAWIVTGSVSENWAKQKGYIELVQCKDCVKRNFDDCPVYGWKGHTDDNWFCADAERKTEDDRTSY